MTRAARRPHRCPCCPDGLDTREALIIARIAAGVHLARIAAELGHTESTVATYVAKARAKLGAHDRAHMVALAFRDRLIGFDHAGRVVVTGETWAAG